MLNITGYSSKPPGKDLVRCRDIFHNFNAVKAVLPHILNGTVSSGRILADLKTSIIRALYKHGIKNSCEKYRPILILPVISHIMKRIDFRGHG